MRIYTSQHVVPNGTTLVAKSIYTGYPMPQWTTTFGQPKVVTG